MGCRNHIAQESKPFALNLPEKLLHSGGIAAGPVKADDQPQADWIVADAEDDWNRRSRYFGSARRGGTPDRNDHCDLPANKIGGKYRQTSIITSSPSEIDRDILALNIAGFVKPLSECHQIGLPRRMRRAAEEPDHRYRRLLRARRERQRRCATK